jgi:hypothetical protein
LENTLSPIRASDRIIVERSDLSPRDSRSRILRDLFSNEERHEHQHDPNGDKNAKQCTRIESWPRQRPRRFHQASTHDMISFDDHGQTDPH